MGIAADIVRWVARSPAALYSLLACRAQTGGRPWGVECEVADSEMWSCVRCVIFKLPDGHQKFRGSADYTFC